MKKVNVFDVTNYINNKLENILSYLSSKYIWFTVLCFLFMVTIMAFATPFGTVLREDAYVYLLKGFEITEGNWVPARSHSIGWSIFLAFFLKLFAIQSLFSGMILSRILSILVVGFSIFPFSGLANKLTDKRSAIIAVLAFALSPILIRTGSSQWSGYSEPIFILLVISTMYFLADSGNKPVNLVIATTLASLSYYVRPNGIFMLGVIVLYLLFLLWHRKINWAFLLLVPCLFFLLSLPHLYTRYEAFGSAFDFGKNSQYFVDSHAQASLKNVPTPSIANYLRTHSIGDYYRKFIYNGLFKIANQFYSILGQVWLLLFFLGSVKYLILDRFSKFYVLFILFFVFVAGLAPVFEIYGIPRHLYVLLPFVFIISSKFLIDLTGAGSRNNILVLSFVLLLLYHSPLRSIMSGINITTPKVQDEWAVWAADNLRGNIAIVEGNDLIKMNLIDKKIGNKNLLNLSAEQLGIYAFRPFSYNRLEVALQDFKKMKVSYLMLDTENIKRRRYLYEVYNTEWSRHFILVRSFKSGPKDKWEIKDMDIFKIAY
ncbi:MAG: hypothetical protein HYW01_06060 [Deltaproteobacteria bacterium]|nr:hypothetical protein [Deltaproteobacteria bacterium]